MYINFVYKINALNFISCHEDILSIGPRGPFLGYHQVFKIPEDGCTLKEGINGRRGKRN